MGRPPRPMYVTQKTIYLTAEEEEAAFKLIPLLRERGIKATCLNDVVGYSIPELLKNINGLAAKNEVAP
jgi:hypothetical protein